MIDFIKFNALNKEQFERNIENNPQINLKSTFDRNTGEASEYPKVAKYHNLEIRITSKGAVIKGSIHRYFNLVSKIGDHNHNDFSFSQCEIAINHLCDSLKIQKEETKITNLEFGFNINTTKSPKSIIDKHVLMYNFSDHNKKHNYRGKGSLKEFEKTDYSIKVYDKSKQYLITDRNILRIELKIINSRYIQRMGVYNLNDLNKYVFKSLFNTFLRHYNKLLIIDSLNAPKDVRIDQVFLFNQCINPNHWNNINYQERKEIRRLFKKIIKKSNYDKLHTLLRDDIIKKYRLLINSNP